MTLVPPKVGGLGGQNSVPKNFSDILLGQYLIYQTFLSVTYPSYKVYLAVSHKIYEKFFAQVAIELILQKYQILLLVIDIKKEEIIKWIS
ncbi:element excision factor XisH family protein [Okeania sp. SIO3B5]|uniref:element excision factor XisH family protein n=1 Tax=Okeania sp. SIO3B5 TaxID=2607811 RepID=UPI003453D35B